MTERSSPSPTLVRGSFRSPSQGAEVSRKICGQLNGTLSRRPDGSLLCRFALAADAEDGARAPGVFSVEPDDILQGAAICSQLGGKWNEDGSGGKCELHLPQEPRWSACSLSRTAGVVHFDADTYYTCAGDENGVTLSVFQSGRLIEALSLTVLPARDGLRVESTSSDGQATRLQLAVKDAMVSATYVIDGCTVFELETPYASAEKKFSDLIARGASRAPHLPYLELLIQRMQQDPAFQEVVLQLAGLSIVPPVQAGPISFCAFACRACLLSLEPHACVAWAFCMGISAGFLATPT